jgi:hypothetical protein
MAFFLRAWLSDRMHIRARLAAITFAVALINVIGSAGTGTAWAGARLLLLEIGHGFSPPSQE